MKHPPGPWVIEHRDENLNTYRIRANLSHRKHEATEESVAILVGTEANARLIATSPELLDRLYECLGYIQADDDHNREFAALIQETINKATGQA